LVIVKDGYYFLAPLLALSLFFFWLGWLWTTAFVLFLGAFVAFFFRDPKRVIPDDSRAIVSPADGKIIRMERKGDTHAVSIFLSIFDVHVNRAPIAGTVVEQEHHPGKFHVAYDDRASVENERLVITIADKQQLTFSLVAGIVARRIVAWKKRGEYVNKGDKIGLIRFGSRVDILLPAESEPAVQRGDRVYGGASILAYWKDEA